jgi:mpaB/rubber oxygenase-like protein
VERDATAFRRYGVDAFYYFGLISLEGYRFEMIYKPLVLTGSYTGGTAFGRYLETCRFWLDTSEPGALRQGGQGRKTAVTIRLMHSMIRRRVGGHREWDAAPWRPIEPERPVRHDPAVIPAESAHQADRLLAERR